MVKSGWVLPPDVFGKRTPARPAWGGAVIRRPPDFVIGGDDRPYLRRWWLIPRNRWFNVYLHHFCRSDDDRALHDHPWLNVSILLRGEYTEVLPALPHDPGYCARYDLYVRRVRRAPAIVFRRPSAAHRIELHAGPVWTLFLTGPKVRSWGFWCKRFWRHWRMFTDPRTGGRTVGPGCE